MSKFSWKAMVSIRLPQDDLDMVNEQTDETFPEFTEETTTRQAFLALVNKATSNAKKSAPTDVKKISELEKAINELNSKIELLENEIGRQKIDIDLKADSINSQKQEIIDLKIENSNLMEASGQAVEQIKTKLPKEGEIVVSFLPYELAVLKLAGEKLTAKFKKEITPQAVLKEIFFSYAREESELNIPYVISYSDRQRIKKEYQ